ncbi:AzlD domain-containing protein [Rhodobacteraceae bacterium 2376]|uniref:AzlD domain-containing protein n=1 Tax=Rhabdonatronobacter sediminivivens TaxID=2743469 RepID=A0A7Z0I007_9RHOB|nr:AzlD domain-containing protein [Rhabdonatronobacter sediminivivens]NYS25421.1 AzlD domain-containing protein [Rhabdonatronobacter sediminivivens]
MDYTALDIWVIILGLGAGTFLLRYSFLGLIGSRDLPEWVLRHLRYTAVAVMPGMIAPMILFPAATDGAPDPARISAAVVTVAVGLLTRNVVLAVVSGAGVLMGLHFLPG